MSIAALDPATLPRAGWRPRVRSHHIVAALLLIACAAFLFIDPETMPIRVWDESRNIVNALEMARDGIGLVTNYGGAPDLWNTKPPLLIWLMVGSVHALGPGEIALRLPSMAAGLGTLLLLFWFARRVTGSLATAILSCALLTLSPAWFGEHGPRTADYDALLVFFTTSYLCLAFIALHRARPSWPLLAMVGGSILCAFLTKSVAALVPGVGIPAYLLALQLRTPGRWRRVFAWRYFAVGAAVLTAIAAFLMLREWQSPHYLQATWFNEVRARFAEPERMGKAPSFYLDQLRAGYFAAPLLLLLAPAGLALAKGRERLVLVFALCIAGTTLLIFTSAAWKLSHYILPAIPFLAIAAAIAAHALATRAVAALRAPDQGVRLAGALLIVVALAPVVTGAIAGIARRYQPPEIGDHGEAGRYRTLFDRLVPRADRRVVTVDPGFVLEGKPHYAPVLLAYRELWAARGVTIAHVTTLPATPHVILASCDPAVASRLAATGRDIAGVAGCTAIRTD